MILQTNFPLVELEPLELSFWQIPSFRWISTLKKVTLDIKDLFLFKIEDIDEDGEGSSFDEFDNDDDESYEVENSDLDDDLNDFDGDIKEFDEEEEELSKDNGMNNLYDEEFLDREYDKDFEKNFYDDDYEGDYKNELDEREDGFFDIIDEDQYSDNNDGDDFYG